jgi:branched-chain amino acid aminotransferase
MQNLKLVVSSDDNINIASKFFSTKIEQAIIQALPEETIVIELESVKATDLIFEKKLNINLLNALNKLEELKIIRDASYDKKLVKFVKNTKYLRTETEGTVGSLEWSMQRLQKLSYEVSSIGELFRLEHLINNLTPPDNLGSHSYIPDPRNASVLIYVNGHCYSRSEARVEALDRSVLLGDGIWESFRVENRHILFFDEHMERFEANARQLLFPVIDRNFYKSEIIKTLIANQMESDVHIRFVVSRGNSITPFQSPKVSYDGPTIIIIPEYKASHASNKGLRLITSPYRRSRSDMFSPELHVTSKIPDIIARLQAEAWGADEPLMLDEQGNVKAGSSTCFFLVKGRTVIVPNDENLLQGVTRQIVINLIKNLKDIKFEKGIISTHDLAKGTEAFVTGTAGGITAVGQIDQISYDTNGPVVKIIQELYQNLIKEKSILRDY